MPTRPPVFRPIGSRTAKDRRKEHDRGRLSAAKRGYDSAWRKLRDAVLADEPLCRSCKAQGRVTAATEVDHIKPFRLAGVINETLRTDRENLQPLCKPCHAVKTALEDGSGWRKRSAHPKPDWLAPSRVPVVVVCGPPASGKSTFVVKSKGERDLVIDLDEIAASLFLPGAWIRRKWPREVLNRSLAKRNDMLRALSELTAPWPRAWLIVSEPTPEGRVWWADKLKAERTVVMLPTATECIKRMLADPARAAARGHQQTIIQAWFEAYKPHPRDETMPP